MAFVYNDTSTDQQGLVQELRFLSGQTSLSIQAATRLFNFALDAYSDIAIDASGRWKFDATTHVDSDGDADLPIATATLGASESFIALPTEFLSINEVVLDGEILNPIDNRDYRDKTPESVYGESGTPQYYDFDTNGLTFYPGNDGTPRTVEIFGSRAAPHFTVTDTTVEIGIPSTHTEFLVLYALKKLSYRTEDVDIDRVNNDLIMFEKKIRKDYSSRDRTTGRKLRAKINVPK